MSEKKKPEYIYLATSPDCPEWVKIGMTTEENPEDRLAGINSAKKKTIKDFSFCDCKEVRDAKTCERHLHDAFSFCLADAKKVKDKLGLKNKPQEFFEIDSRIAKATLSLLDVETEIKTSKNDSGFIYLATSDDCSCEVKIGIAQNESIDINNPSIRYYEKVNNPELCKKQLLNAFAFYSYTADDTQDKIKINWRAARAALLFMKTARILTMPTTLTSLMCAAITCNIKSVEKTLQKSSEEDINMQRGGGRTALMWAIDPENKLMDKRTLDTEEERRPIIVEKIISYADIEITTDNGKTALIIAAKHGKDYAVKMLLDAGAKKDVKCHGGWTALDYALAYEHKTDAHKKIISLLRE